MKEYFKVLLILLLPLLAVVGYSYNDNTVGLEFTQIDHARIDTIMGLQADSVAVADTLQADSVVVDTLPQRILFIGDSMVEGLAPRMAQYAAANGHELTYVCWYSSTTYCWDSDTLLHFIREADPTFIMITIGGNEQPMRDLKPREECIKRILAAFGDTPYIWICTPEWKKDAPFNFIPERLCGPKRFFDSRRLTYERGKDHCHPTLSSSARWMDSIAVWMQDPALTAHPILMAPPPADAPKAECRHHILQPDPNANRPRKHQQLSDESGSKPAAKTEAPKKDGAPAKTAPKTEAPSKTAPKKTAAKSDAPAKAAPKTDAPAKTTAPKTEPATPKEAK